MNIPWRMLLALLVGAALTGANRIDLPADDDTTEIDETEHAALGDDFMYDVTARFNETLLASNDSTDNALIAVLAGTAAVAALAIDKIRETATTSEAVALGLLSASALASLVGYALSYPWTNAFNTRDGTRPRRFVPDFVDNPEAATALAIEELTRSGEANLRLRRAKKAMVILAVILLLAGAVVVAVARLNGKVV